MSYELNQKIKQLEREKAALVERLELVSRDQISEQGNLSKKVEKLQDSIERLQVELDTVKRDRDAKIAEMQQKIEKEREMFNQKKRELESKGLKADSKQTEVLLTHERERAKWEQQLTDMIFQRDEFKSENERLKMKVDSYFKEIEKLKLDIKNLKKTQYASYGQPQSANFTSNISSMGQGISQKYNLPARNSGYTPGMYASARGGQDSNGQESERAFVPRYGVQPIVKEANQSMEFSKVGASGFLSQSMAMGKGKGLSSLVQGKDELVVTDDTLNSSVLTKNLVSTPSSKNDDTVLLNKGSDDE